jgi:hypothetical protein
VALPEQLLLSDLLRLRVRCDQGLDHGPGVVGWMHPPVHRLLGWASRPSAFRPQRQVWRLDQLRGLSDSEVFVKGEPAAADAALLEQLPTLLQASLLGAGGRPLGTVADAAVELGSGRILHYLIARSDPRLPGSSRWRLTPDRIFDQRSGVVETALEGLDDLPLARSSVRQELLRRSRRWREQVGEETSRLREQFEVVGGRLEERVEGWLEEPPWEEGRERSRRSVDDPEPAERWQEGAPDPLDDWPADGGDSRDGSEDGPFPSAPAPSRPLPRSGRRAAPIAEPWDEPEGPATDASDIPAPRPDRFDPSADAPPDRPPRGPDRYRGRDRDDDPWI